MVRRCKYRVWPYCGVKTEVRLPLLDTGAPPTWPASCRRHGRPEGVRRSQAFVVARVVGRIGLVAARDRASGDQEI
jgi:hypothetical protein